MIPGRAAGGRIVSFPGTCLPGCSKPYFPIVFYEFRITIRFHGLFFLGMSRNHGFPLVLQRFEGSVEGLFFILEFAGSGLYELISRHVPLCIHNARRGNHVFPMVFKGFPITVRFPIRRRGTQRTAPYCICPDMQKHSFPQ